MIEAPDLARTQYGVERLIEILQHSAAEPLHVLKDAVLSAVRSHAGGSLTQDDVTVLVVEIGMTPLGLL